MINRELLEYSNEVEAHLDRIAHHFYSMSVDDSKAHYELGRLHEYVKNFSQVTGKYNGCTEGE